MKIRVGQTYYDLEKVTADELDNLTSFDSEKYEVAGDCDRFGAKIYINNDLPNQTIKQSFFHELIHAVLYETGEIEHNEEFVERISLLIYGFFEDNKINKIMKYLEGEEEI